MKLGKFIAVLAAVWVITLAAPLTSAGQQPASGLRSNGQSVVLVARMPETASMAWSAKAVPQAALQDGQSGEMVVLQQWLTFERGQTVEATGQIVTDPAATAQVFTSRPQARPAGAAKPASFPGGSFDGAVQAFPVVDGFDPGKGALRDTQILMIVGAASEDASSGVLRITMVAF